MRPIRPVSRKPMFVHVAPESVERYTPSPITSASRIAHASPVPAHTIAGLDDELASAPIACTGCLSNTGTKVLTLSMDFQTPPEALPTYQTRGLPGPPTIAAIRPPEAGPMNWKRKGSCSGARGGAGRTCAPATVAANDSVAMRARRVVAESSSIGRPLTERVSSRLAQQRYPARTAGGKPRLQR